MNAEVRTIFGIAVALCLAVGATPTPAAETLRIGLQSTGTFAWQLDVIRRHGLADNAGLDLKISEFASPDAGKLAINGGSVDLAVVDWLWVARARALGAKLLFYPYSSAVGAIIGLLGQHVGNETSDPKKVAQVVLKLAYHDQPPMHLLLGSDALHYAGEAEKARAASGEAWREVSVATDYAAPATLPNFPQS